MRISKLMTIATVLVFASSAAVFAQTAQTQDSASLTLTGSVAGRVSITVNGVGDFSSLNLMEDLNDEIIAEVTEQSNVSSGYTVTISSANFADGSPRFAGGAGSDTLAYSLSYDGEPIDFSSNAPVITDESDRLASVSGVTKNLAISYLGTAVNIVEGSYSDTLTFEIQAK